MVSSTGGKRSTQSLWVRPAAGEWVRREIRNIAINGTTVYIAICEPWGNTTDAGMEWEIVVDTTYMPSDAERLLDCRFRQGNGSWTGDVRFLQADQADTLRLNGAPEAVGESGTPSYAYQRNRRSVPSPKWLTGATTSGTWIGPDIAGSFEYCITYVLGTHTGPGLPGPVVGVARRRHLLESLPSPVVAASPGTDEGGTNVPQLTFTNLAQQLNFDTGLRAAALTGYYIRIWRRNLGESDRFYLLDTVLPNVGTYVDVGLNVPDFNTPLLKSGGHLGVSFSPRPEPDVEMDIRYMATPLEIIDDSDPLDLPPGAVNAIIYGAAMQLAMSQGSTELRNTLERLYKAELRQMSETYASFAPPAQVFTRGSRTGRTRSGMTIRSVYVED
tara:strand:- start:249 stop:1406 length:1158 start_codon:yes stop_codon:yes gene_type:complete